MHSLPWRASSRRGSRVRGVVPVANGPQSVGECVGATERVHREWLNHALGRCALIGRVGSHVFRHLGSRRKANGSSGGAAKRNAVETPVAQLCASECQEVFPHPSSRPWQSSRKKP